VPSRPSPQRPSYSPEAEWYYSRSNQAMRGWGAMTTYSVIGRSISRQSIAGPKAIRCSCKRWPATWSRRPWWRKEESRSRNGVEIPACRGSHACRGGKSGLTVAALAVPPQPLHRVVVTRGLRDDRLRRVPPGIDRPSTCPRSLVSGRDARAPGRDARAPVGREQPDAGGSLARLPSPLAARWGPGVPRVQVRVRPLQPGGRRHRIVDTQGARAGETPALPGGRRPASLLVPRCSFLAGREAS
jgi:hypothetical protein